MIGNWFRSEWNRTMNRLWLSEMYWSIDQIDTNRGTGVLVTVFRRSSLKEKVEEVAGKDDRRKDPTTENRSVKRKRAPRHLIVVVNRNRFLLASSDHKKKIKRKKKVAGLFWKQFEQVEARKRNGPINHKSTEMQKKNKIELMKVNPRYFWYFV